MYQIKENLFKVANQLFSYTEKELEGDIDLKNDFDFITPETYGLMSSSPKEYMEKETLLYNKLNNGRNFVSSFITLAMQSGYELGLLKKQDEIIDLKDDVAFWKEQSKSYMNAYSRLQKKYCLDKMPDDGDLENEVRRLREELANAAEMLKEVREIKAQLKKFNKDIEGYLK